MTGLISASGLKTIIINLKIIKYTFKNYALSPSHSQSMVFAPYTVRFQIQMLFILIFMKFCTTSKFPTVDKRLFWLLSYKLIAKRRMSDQISN